MNGMCEHCGEFIHFDESCVRIEKGKINLEDEFEREGYLYFHEECLIE